MLNRLHLSIFTLLFVPLIAHANDAPTPVPVPTWNGEGELGFTQARGNTDSNILNAKLGLGRSDGPWDHSINVEALNNTTGGVRTAEQYVVGAKTKYAYNERAYSFAALNWQKDHFAAFRLQQGIEIGAGRNVLHEPDHSLDLSLGLGYRETVANDAALTKKTNPTVSVGLNYLLGLSPSATFTQDLNVTTGKDNTYTEAVTGLKVTINASLALKSSYTVKHNSTVPVGSKATDTVTAVTLVYGF
ncbi:MAG: hypothetical protein COX57_00655 [Alphaproteobacteria bacterium CG_4_10_14_0_2_um_filter_63_37]|nr:MAG: hypothetical protein AUJ55_05435 [Proteobacteria bacterium CG1_02_64_396]PJA25987.1 MAG: hypothetical protein COX57_00655 [Alphaproteobacteria bacterium CG_4_10_14_0_2_um_filter_63_37]